MVNGKIRTSVRRVLVMDDESLSRERLRAEILALGFEVVDTGHPGTAVEYCEEFDFDLVISSLNVRSLAGSTFLQLIRLRHPHLPIVVLSPFYSMENTATAFRYGASEFLRKPEDRGKIRSILMKLLASNHTRPCAA